MQSSQRGFFLRERLPFEGNATTNFDYTRNVDSFYDGVRVIVTMVSNDNLSLKRLVNADERTPLVPLTLAWCSCHENLARRRPPISLRKSSRFRISGNRALKLLQLAVPIKNGNATLRRDRRCVARIKIRRNGTATEIFLVERLRDENFGQLSVGRIWWFGWNDPCPGSLQLSQLSWQFGYIARGEGFLVFIRGNFQISHNLGVYYACYRYICITCFCCLLNLVINVIYGSI